MIQLDYLIKRGDVIEPQAVEIATSEFKLKICIIGSVATLNYLGPASVSDKVVPSQATKQVGARVRVTSGPQVYHLVFAATTES